MAIGAAIVIDAGVDGGMTGCAHKCARHGAVGTAVQRIFHSKRGNVGSDGHDNDHQ
jgi:hypothetical protein